MVAIDNSKQNQSKENDRIEDRSTAGNNDAFNALDLLKEGKSVNACKSSADHVPELTLTDNSKGLTKDAKAEDHQDSSAVKRASDHAPMDKKAEESHAEKKESALDGLKHFGQGLLTGIFLEPINGLTQLSNHTLGTNIAEIHFSNQKDVEESAAGKLGRATSKAAEVVAVGAATSGVGAKIGLTGKKASALDAVLAGSIDGGILTPVSDKNGDFWTNRMNNAVSGATVSLVNDFGDKLLSKKTAEKLPVAASKTA